MEQLAKELHKKINTKFTANNDRIWFKMLQKLIDDYNNTEHRTIKMTPVEASQKKNFDEVYLNLFNVKPIKEVKPKLIVGDWVRISRIKGIFEKGYIPNWSREIFKVRKVLDTTPVTYDIEEYDSTPIEGSFYEQELQKTEQTDSYLIDEVLESKVIKGKGLMHKVHWLGWNKKYDSWISDKELKDIKQIFSD